MTSDRRFSFTVDVSRLTITGNDYIQQSDALEDL